MPTAPFLIGGVLVVKLLQLSNLGDVIFKKVKLTFHDFHGEDVLKER